MPHLNVSRRNLMQATALGAGAAVALTDQAIAAPKGKSAIVIGSGFGGAVAAFRLGQAGFSTTVLERGDIGEVTETKGEGLSVLNAAGLGGGSSLGTFSLAQPRRAEWQDASPAEVSYDLMDSTYWPRARKNLGAKVSKAKGGWREDVAAFSGGQADIPFSSTGLDQTYLAWAQATGNVALLANHEVTEIHEMANGFEVRCHDKTFRADYLFMAAGAVHTTSLLVTAREQGWLPKLRAAAGQGFGNNGDFFLARLNVRHDAGDDVALYDDGNPFAKAAMTLAPATLPAWAGRAAAHVVTSMAPERGEIRFNRETSSASVYWPYGVLETKGEKAAQDLATRLWWEAGGRKGKLLSGLPSYDREAGLGAATTWHPLGGMVMGQSTDFSGRSLDYANLYCVDGSVLPGTSSLGSPALIITANAERCLDLFLAKHA